MANLVFFLFWQTSDRAVYGAKGGFQEFIVEAVEGKMVRVTYVSVEATQMQPGEEGRRNFGRLPWLLVEMHIMYAQSLLWGAVGRLGRLGS